MLPLVSGLKRAKEVLYLCRRYSGQAAVDMGLANVVVADDEVDPEVERWTASSRGRAAEPPHRQVVALVPL